MTNLTLEEKKELIRRALRPARGLCALFGLSGRRGAAGGGRPRFHRLQCGERRLYPDQLRRTHGSVQGGE